MQTSGHLLDETVAAARAGLAELEVPAPDLLLLMATGPGGLVDQLRHAREHALAEVAAIPSPWCEETLHSGELGSLTIWVLPDVSDDPADPGAWGGSAPAPSWVGGFPIWLAAAAGACVLVHTSAGCLLAQPEGAPKLEAGKTLAVLRDHINLSGETPLHGLGASSLGPLFPDLSALHHFGLRRAAMDRAESLGLRLVEMIAACTTGPAIETPAERRMLARLGAELAVQALATPLLAAGHAGLAVLSLVCIADAGEDPTDLVSMIEAAGLAQPRLEELLLRLSEDLERTVHTLRAPS
jgi:hypothetical protein